MSFTTAWTENWRNPWRWFKGAHVGVRFRPNSKKWAAFVTGEAKPSVHSSRAAAMASAMKRVNKSLETQP